MRNQSSSRGSRLARALAVLAAVISFTLAGERTASASSVCVKSVTSDLAMNGIVADGTPGPTCAATMAVCAPGPVWGGIAPYTMSTSIPIGVSSMASGLASVALRTGTTKRLFFALDVTEDTDISNHDVVYVLFDANDNGSWDDHDFILGIPISSSDSPIETGAECCQMPGTIDYYSWNPSFGGSGGWVKETNAAIGNATSARIAYDYETAVDSESKIYNLEVNIPIGLSIGGQPYYRLETGSGTFRIGAYEFVDFGHLGGPGQNGMVLRWPDSMKDRLITEQDFNYDSDFGGGASIPKPAPADLAEAKIDGKCFDVSFAGVSNPWDWVNGVTPEPWDQAINRTGDNKFRVRFKYDGPAGTTGSVKNVGSVEVGMNPYTAGSGLGTRISQSSNKTLANYPQEYVSETITFHGSAFDPSVDHVCADSKLNFQIDDDPSNNSTWTNFRFFPTSTHTEKVRLEGRALPKTVAGESPNVYLHFDSTNDPEAGKKPPEVAPPFVAPRTPSRSRWQPVGAALFAAVALLAAAGAVFGRRGARRWALSCASLLGALACHAVVTVGPQPPQPPQPPVGPPHVGEGRWQLKNAEALGLKAVPGRKDWYMLALGRNETKDLEIEFQGMKLPYQPTRYKLAPSNQEGGPNKVRVPIPANQVVTVLAFGQIDPDGKGPLPPVSAAGTIAQAAVEPAAVAPKAEANPSLVKGGKAPPILTHPSATTAPRYLLRSGYYSPEQYSGTLIGSFDDFKSSFVIGTHGSFIAPANGSELSLAVNYGAGQYRLAEGELNLVLIFTVPPRAPTHAPIRGNVTYDIPPSIDPWKVLTTLAVSTYLDVRRGDPGPERAQTLAPWGTAYMSVYDSHVGGGR